jgi:hypothetical protein
MEELLKSYGLAGIVIVALAAYVLRIEKRHTKERKEWKESQDRQFDRVNEMTDESNKVLRENTNILSGLKSLLEHRK